MMKRQFPKETENLCKKKNRNHYYDGELIEAPMKVLSTLFSQFIILGNLKTELRTLAARNSSTCDFQYNESETHIACIISKQIIAVCEVSASHKLSLELVSTKAIKRLQEICYTIEKNVFNPNSSGENVKTGYHELQQGGLELNKNGQIDNKQFLINYGRNQNNSQTNEKKIKSVLHNYFTQKDYYKDLVFSPDFTKDQRAKIHSKAQSFRLVSKSCGNNDNRFLTISKKIDDHFLLSILKEGSNPHLCEKYRLIQPVLCEDKIQLISDDEIKIKFSDFILFIGKNSDPETILRESAEINKAKYSYENYNKKVAVILSSKIIALNSSETTAAKNALKRLQKMCTSVKRKRQFVTKKIYEPKDIKQNQIESMVIDKSNKGYQMLLSLGWSGTGGLGKNRNGIIHPVQTEVSVKHGGFGALCIDEDVLKNIFQSYLDDANYYGDVVFSNNFCESDKPKILKIAKNLGLVEMKVLNVEELIISRNIFAFDFIYTLQKNLNAQLSKKYEIINVPEWNCIQ